MLPHAETILVVIGPSGSGKSSAIQQLASEGVIEVTPSWTTRPPRPGELEHGLEHRFVSEQELVKKQRAGCFLEVVEMFGLPYKYALPPLAQTDPAAVPTVMLRAALLPAFSTHYKNYRVYEIEDDLKRVKERLEARQRDGEEIGSRLKDYDREVAKGRQLADRVIVNDADLDSLVDRVRAVIQEDFR